MKSDAEIQFDSLCDAYREKFGKNYGIMVCDSRPLQEHIKILQHALDTGKPVRERKIPPGMIV